MIIRIFAERIKKMRSTNEILETLKVFKPKAESEYGITVLGLFGSCARGQQHDGSDVDICFDGKTPTLITIAKMENELEELIGSPVQMIMLHDGLSKAFVNNIKKDVIYV